MEQLRSLLWTPAAFTDREDFLQKLVQNIA